MEFRPLVPPKPSDLSAVRPSIPRPPPIRRSSSAASTRPPAPDSKPTPSGSDGELEQLRLYYSYGGPTAPHGGPTAPHGGPAAPHGGPTAPHGGPTAPHGGPAAPHGGPTAPHGSPAAPHGGPTAPHGGPTAPHGGPTAPHGGPTAPVLPSTPETGKGKSMPDKFPEIDLVGQSKRAQLGKLIEEMDSLETKHNFTPTEKSTTSSAAKRTSANNTTSKVTNISIQAKFNLNRSFGYKAMDSHVSRSSAFSRQTDESPPNSTLSVMKSDSAKPNIVMTPKLAVSNRSQSSPLETSFNTTPKIISATLKNGQQIRFSSPSRDGDSIDGNAPAASSSMTLDSPRSRGRKSNARRLLIKTPLHSADAKYPRSQCPFSPIDKVDPKCKQLAASLPCGASSERRERRNSIQSKDEQQIQELNSFLSMSLSTPFASTNASRDNLVNAAADEPQEDFIRTTPKQNPGVPEGIKRLSSIRGPINKMRDSLKKALSNPCSSAGPEASASWQQLPEPSPERTTLPPTAAANTTPLPALDASCGRMVRSVASQTLPTVLDDTTMLYDPTILHDTTAQEKPRIVRRLWGVLTDALRRAWQRLQEALIKLLYPHHNKG